VGDGRPERALHLGARHVDVNPLMIAGEIGEPVDHLLRHLTPRTRAHHLILQLPQIVDPTDHSLGNARFDSQLVPFHRIQMDAR
jgi:hypothetical protein